MLRTPLLIVCFLLSFFIKSFSDELPNKFEDVLSNPDYVKSPTKAQYYQKFVKANGKFQAHVLEDRFVFVFDPNGCDPFQLLRSFVEKIMWTITFESDCDIVASNVRKLSVVPPPETHE